MTATLWIVRHGNTFEAGEPPRRIGARTDPPLTGEGRAQAERLAARFAADGIAFDTVLAGPLARTRETAEVVAGGAPDIADFLAEIDHGCDEDAEEAAVLERVGAAALAAWDGEAVAPPGWIVDAPARIAAWRGLFDRTCGHTLLVTSNGAARFALVAGALRPASFKLRTGAWGRIDVTARKPRLVEWDVRA